MYCRYCGAELPDNASYCSSCRRPLVDMEKTSRLPEEDIDSLEKKILGNMEDEMMLNPVQEASALEQRNTREWTEKEQESFARRDQEYRRSIGEDDPPRYPGQEEIRPKKKKKGPIIALVAVLAVVLAGTITAAVIFTNPTNRLKRAAGDRDFERAESIYEASFKGKTKESKADEIFSDAVAGILSDYKEEKITGEKAEDCLTELIAFWNKDEATKAYETIQILEASREAYKAAELCMDNKDYPGAISYYSQVNEADPNYNKAIEAIEDAKTLYESKILNDAEELIQRESFEEAIALLEEGIKYFGENSKMTAKIKEAETAKSEKEIKTAQETAKNYEAQGNYYEALKTLEEALETYPDNKELKNLLEEEKKVYRDSVLNHAEEALNGSDANYNAAILVLDTAIESLGDEYPEITKVLEEQKAVYQADAKTAPENVLPGIWDCVSVRGGILPVSPGVYKTLQGLTGDIFIELFADGQYYLQILDFYEVGHWSGGKTAGADGSRTFTLTGENEMRQMEVTADQQLKISYNNRTFVFEKD